MNFNVFLRRFVPGVAVGMLLALIAWSYSIFFGVSISLIHGLIGTVVLAIACGAIAVTTNFSTLMDRLPFL